MAMTLEQSTQYAESLARSIWEKHYRTEAPNWEPMSGDLYGLLSQIDNMVTGIAHLSARAKVRVTDEDVDCACDVYDDHYTAEVLSSGVGSDNHSQALRAVLEDFAARLSQGAQAKVRVTDDAELEALWANIWQWEESHSPDLEESLIALRDYLNEAFAARLSQGAQGEAVPDFGKCHCVGDFGPNPDCSRCGGDGTINHPTERAAVPDGWKLVPKELTLSMSVRGKWALCDHTIKPEDFKRAWREMLTAAPQPPEVARVVPGVRERNGDAYLVDSARNDPDHAASPLYKDPRAFEVTFASNGRVQYLPPDCADIAESCRKQGNMVVPLFAFAAPTLAGKEG